MIPAPWTNKLNVDEETMKNETEKKMLNFSFCVIFALPNSIAGRYALILVQSQTVNICPMAVGLKKKIKLSKKFTEFSLNWFVVFLVRNYDELILLLDLIFI